MALSEINPVNKVKGLGTVFSTTTVSEAVMINNYRYVDFLIYSGEGIYGEITVTVQGAEGVDGEWQDINFYKVVDGALSERTSDVIAIGRSGDARYRVESDLLDNKKIDRVRLCTTKVTASIVNGLIISMQGNPRYS